jgi:hypothetical protein
MDRLQQTSGAGWQAGGLHGRAFCHLCLVWQNLNPKPKGRQAQWSRPGVRCRGKTDRPGFRCRGALLAAARAGFAAAASRSRWTDRHLPAARARLRSGSPPEQTHPGQEGNHAQASGQLDRQTYSCARRPFTRLIVSVFKEVPFAKERYVWSAPLVGLGAHQTSRSPARRASKGEAQ